MAFDCSNTDGLGMMCAFLARAVTNSPGVGNVEYSNVSEFTMFVDRLVYYIDMASKGLKISCSSTWRDLHNTDNSDMTCSSQGAGDICDFSVYLNGLVYYIDRICTAGRGMMSSVPARAISKNGGVRDVKKVKLSNFVMFMAGRVYYIDQACDEAKMAFPTRRGDRHNTHCCDMRGSFMALATGNKQRAGDIFDFSMFMAGLVYPIDLASDEQIPNPTTLVNRKCADDRRMMCSSLALVVGNTQSAGDVEYSYISVFAVFADSLVYCIELASVEERIASGTLYVNGNHAHGHGLMCSFPTSALGNKQGAADISDATVFVDGLVYYIDPASEKMKIAVPPMVVDHNDRDRRGFVTTRARTWRTGTKARAGLMRSFLRWSL